MALASLPPELPRMAVACAFVIVLMLVFWRWLKIATFDEGFAEALGIPATALGLGLVITAAIAAVAAFDAVGSIIVIAMFICPPAAARLMTNRLETQVWWSVTFAALSAVLGYVFAGYGPPLVRQRERRQCRGYDCNRLGRDPRAGLSLWPPPRPRRCGP